jgi:hypothetical protein
MREEPDDWPSDDEGEVDWDKETEKNITIKEDKKWQTISVWLKQS